MIVPLFLPIFRVEPEGLFFGRACLEKRRMGKKDLRKRNYHRWEIEGAEPVGSGGGRE